MPQISKRFERRPIGRQIKREINGETEPGLVSGMYSMAAPEWRTVYTVRWKPVNEQEYDEHLALKTVQHYYKSDDTYANEPFVDEEIRLLQQYNWDERKCPKKGTPEFDKEILERVSRHATFAGPASAVVLDDQDEDIDIGGEAPHPHKNESSSGVVGSIAKIISTLSAAPSCQAQTSDHQGEDCDFEATGLQPAEQGNHGADSPTEADAALREEEDEEMVELAAGAEPQSIPKRVMMCKGDVPVDVHSAEDYEENEEYVVDSIVAQRGRGKNLQYMVKWKGYEMDPEAWTPRGNLKDTLALAHWEKALRGKGAAAGGTQRGKKRKSGH
ncbi:hypothetical protein WJX79_008145 [Trebouxia sp. C0005]